jgi:hypothetical protein
VAEWRVETENGDEIPVTSDSVKAAGPVTFGLEPSTAEIAAPNPNGLVYNRHGTGLVEPRTRLKVYRDDELLLVGDVMEARDRFTTHNGRETGRRADLTVASLPWILTKRYTGEDQFLGDSDQAILKHLLQETVLQREPFVDQRNLATLNNVELVDGSLRLEQNNDETYPSSGRVESNARTLKGPGNKPTSVTLDLVRSLGGGTELIQDDIEDASQIDEGASSGDATVEEGIAHAQDRTETKTGDFSDTTQAALLDGCTIENGELQAADQHPIDDDFDDGTVQGWSHDHVYSSIRGDADVSIDKVEDSAMMADAERLLVAGWDTYDDYEAKVSVVDVSDPGNPVETETDALGDCEDDSVTIQVDESVNRAWVAYKNSDSNLEVASVNVADPDSLYTAALNTIDDYSDEVGSESAYSAQHEIFVVRYGDYTDRLVGIDVSSRDDPSIAWEVDENQVIPDTFNDVEGEGDNLFLIGTDGVVSLDFIDGSERDYLSVGPGTVTGIDYHAGNEVVYVSDDDGELALADVSDPASMANLDESYGNNYCAKVRATPKGDQVVTYESGGGHHVWDVSDPNNIEILETMNVGRYDGGNASVLGRELWTPRAQGLTVGQVKNDANRIRLNTAEAAKSFSPNLLSGSLRAQVDSRGTVLLSVRNGDDQLIAVLEVEDTGEVYLWEPPTQGSTEDLTDWDREFQGGLGGSMPRVVKLYWDLEDETDPVVEAYDGTDKLGEITRTGPIRNGADRASIGAVRTASDDRHGDVDAYLDNVKVFGSREEPTLDTDWTFESTAFDTAYEARKAALDVAQTVPTGTGIVWKISLDGGATFQEVEPDAGTDGEYGPETWYEDILRGQDIVVRIEATGDGGSNSPSVDEYHARIANGWETGKSVVQSSTRNQETFTPQRANCSADQSVPSGVSTTFEVTFDGGGTWYAFDPAGDTVEPSAGDVSDPPDVRWRVTGDNPGEDGTWTVDRFKIVTEDPTGSGSLTPYVSTDGGQTWHEVTAGQAYDLTQHPGEAKRGMAWRLDLATSDSGVTPRVEQVKADWVCEGYDEFALGTVNENVASLDTSYLHQQTLNALKSLVDQAQVDVRWRLDPASEMYLMDWGYEKTTHTLRDDVPTIVDDRATDTKRDRVKVVG